MLRYQVNIYTPKLMSEYIARHFEIQTGQIVIYPCNFTQPVIIDIKDVLYMTITPYAHKLTILNDEVNKDEKK